MDYNTAIRRAIENLSDAGVGAIAYKSGRVDSLEVAVRRAVVTGANQTAAKTQEVLADELGVELVEVTAHGGARPEHAKWQGKVFSRHGDIEIDGVKYKDLKKATGYGSGAGLCGWNCRHTFHPYIHGAPRSWSDKELKELDKKNITYNGEKYTEYEASQIQRGIEREIRKHKRTVAAIEAGGGDASAERAKLRKAQKEYTKFTEDTGLKKQTARTKIGTPKAEKVVKEAYKTADVKTPTKKDIQKQRDTAQNTNNVLTNTVNSDKIELKPDINKMITPREKAILDTVPKKSGYFDFAAHGTPTNIEYGARGNTMTARELARIIRHNEAYNGEKVRLLSCSTGATVDGFAQLLANALGVEVEAPEDLLFVFSDGHFEIGVDGKGKMKTFKPYGKE
jgi:hypothetical protein